MGTSNAYNGPGGNTPLIPTWLDPGSENAPPVPEGEADSQTTPPTRPTPQPPPVPDRFQAARGNFSRFASSGGGDRASLGRAVAGYVTTASGGARQAARHMGASRTAGANLLGFLSDVRARGVQEALHALNLERLAGRPIEDVFLGLADYVCPDGGTVDEGIARGAFIETIVDLAGLGVTNLDGLTADQMQTVFELYATHAIEARLYNDIGMKGIVLPIDTKAASRVQAQLRDFVRRGVADALTAARAALVVLTPDHVLEFVDSVYETAFEILQTLGEAEAKRV